MTPLHQVVEKRLNSLKRVIAEALAGARVQDSTPQSLLALAGAQRRLEGALHRLEAEIAAFDGEVKEWRRAAAAGRPEPISIEEELGRR